MISWGPVKEKIGTTIKVANHVVAVIAIFATVAIVIWVLYYRFSTKVEYMKVTYVNCERVLNNYSLKFVRSKYNQIFYITYLPRAKQWVESLTPGQSVSLTMVSHDGLIWTVASSYYQPILQSFNLHERLEPWAEN